MKGSAMILIKGETVLPCGFYMQKDETQQEYMKRFSKNYYKCFKVIKPPLKFITFYQS